MGECHSRKRVARLMRQAGLAGRYPRRFRRTTIADPLTLNPDLVQREFAPTGPNRLWVGEFTYIRTWEGWLCLAVLLDRYSRRVVGWSMADHLRTELPLEALRMALARRGPAPDLIHHTDRGCQYTSETYTKVLNAHRIRSSLSRPHKCWDCRRRELLRHLEVGPGVQPPLAHTSCSPGRDPRLHRRLL
jgi:transposase InsO family protein